MPSLRTSAVYREHVLDGTPGTNVEKAVDTGERKVIATIDTYRIQLEMSEIVTLERMGVGVPVLLVEPI